MIESCAPICKRRMKAVLRHQVTNAVGLPPRPRYRNNMGNPLHVLSIESPTDQRRTIEALCVINRRFELAETACGIDAGIQVRVDHSGGAVRGLDRCRE